MTITEFKEITASLFDEYLPKINKSDRKLFTNALMDELIDSDIELEPESDEDEEDSGGDFGES